MSGNTIAGKRSRKLGAREVAARPSPRSAAERYSLYLAMAGLGVVVFAAFANSLGNEFVFDDKQIILDQPLLRSLANLPKVLASSYRPLRDISHMLDFAIWGENPAGFHLTNILIHLANTLLVFTLIRRIAGDIFVALAAACIFAVHPIQTDAVTYISGRRDVLFTLFYLASFRLYLEYKARRSWAFLVMFLAAWALSLMSKEMAASLPIVIFVWNFVEVWPESAPAEASTGKAESRLPLSAGRLWRALRDVFLRDRWLYLALIPAVVAYAWYMIFVKGASIRARAGFNYWGGSFAANALTVVRVHAWYLKQLVWPTPIIQYKGAFDAATTLLDWRVLVSLLAVGGTFIGGLWALGRHRLIAFAVLSYFALLLPVSQIVPHHELLADHYLYLPMMSFGLLVGLVARELARRGERSRKVITAGVAVVVTVLSAMTALRNRAWKDDLSLWQTNYREVPNSIRAASSLAKAYAPVNPGRSEEMYRRCLEIDPAYGPAYYSLSALVRSREKAAELEKLIRAGLTVSDSQIEASLVSQEPSMFRSQLTSALGTARLSQGDADGAERYYADAISLCPMNPQPYTLLANFYRPRDSGKAVATLKRLVAAFPGRPEPLEQVATVLVEERRDDEAIVYLQQLLGLIPNDVVANLQLSAAYRRKNDCAHSLAAFRAARAAAASPTEQRDVRQAATELRPVCGEP